MADDRQESVTPGWGNHDPRYKRGYDDGESSGYADWEFALMDVLPEDIEPLPGPVADYVRSLQRRLDPG